MLYKGKRNEVLIMAMHISQFYPIKVWFIWATSCLVFREYGV